jgi:hypothetical protein
MAKQAHLQAILSAVDRLTPVLGRIGGSVTSLKATFALLNGVNFNGLRGSMRVLNKSVKDVFGAAQSSAEKLMPLLGLGGLSAAGLGLGFLSSARGAMQYAASVQDASDITGVAYEDLQRLQGVMRLGGLETETANEAIVKFNKSIADGAAGKDKSFAAMMTRLRIPLRGANREIRSAVDILPELADAIEKNQNPAVRTRLLMEAFGKTGAKLVPTLKDGGKALRELMAAQGDMGKVLSEKSGGALDKLDENLEELGVQYKVLSGEVLATAAPAVLRVVQLMQKWVAANRGLIQQRLGAVVERIANAFAKWIESGGFERLVDGAARAWQTVSDLVTRLGGLGNVAKILGVLILAGPVASLVSLGAAIGRLALAVLPMLTRAILLVGRAFLLNPIGLVVTAIAAAGYLIYRNWSTVGPFFASMWETIKSTAMTAWNVLRFLFSWSPLGIIVNNWGAITEWVGELWTSVTDAVQVGVDAIGAKLAEWSPLDWVKKAWDPVLSFLQGVWDRVSVLLGPMLRLIGAGANAVGSAAGQAFNSVASMAADQFGPNSNQQYGPRINAPTPLVAAGAMGGTARVQGDMRVRFENAPPGMRVDPGTTSSPGLQFNPDVGYKGMGGIG